MPLISAIFCPRLWLWDLGASIINRSGQSDSPCVWSKRHYVKCASSTFKPYTNVGIWHQSGTLCLTMTSHIKEVRWPLEEFREGGRSVYIECGSFIDDKSKNKQQRHKLGAHCLICISINSKRMVKSHSQLRTN